MERLTFSRRNFSLISLGNTYSNIMKIGIRIKITEETEEYSHYLFEVYNLKEFNEKQYPAKIKETIIKLKNNSTKLIREF